MRQKGHAITPVWEKQQLSDREEIWSCLCFMQWFLNTKWLCSPGREIRIQVPMLSKRLLPHSIAAVISAPYFPHVPDCSLAPMQRVALVTAQWLPKAFWHAFTASWSHLDKHPISSSTLLAGLRHSDFPALTCLIRVLRIILQNSDVPILYTSPDAKVLSWIRAFPLLLPQLPTCTLR